MKVDIVSSMLHYYDHVKPIFDALPEELQGHSQPGKAYPDPGNIGLLASWADLEPLRGHYEYIYVEHGAGQTYGGDVKSALQPGYSGSGGYRHIGCIGFISPSQTVADRWTTAPAIAVGCPKLDRWRHEPNPRPLNVCIAFHWDSGISPEARSTWPYWGLHLPRMVARLRHEGFAVYGHAHPKMEGRPYQEMERCGIEVLPDEVSVFRACGSLIMDNSSLMYEFASLGRPVVALNAPWYRKEVEHGLRFWGHCPGVWLDDIDQFCASDIGLLMWGNGSAKLHRRAAAAAYAFQDDQCAQRAADFVVRRLGETRKV